MEIRALGGLELRVDGEVVGLGGTKPALLLATLLVDAGTTVSADRLELALWGDKPPKSSAHAIQVYVSRLRGLLGAGMAIVTEGSGYRLTIDRDAYDVHRFEDLAEGADATEDLADRARLLRAAVDLFGGRPFGRLGDEPAIQVEVQRLEMLRSEVVEQLFTAELELGRHRRAVGEIEEELARSPLRERLWQLLMLALYRSGRQAEALRAYARLRSVLGEELGIEPDRDSRELETKVLLQDPSLDLPRHERGNLPAAVTSFVGRVEEAALVAEALERNRIVTLHGPPGIGKSRLALEVARAVKGRFDGGVFLVDVTDAASARVVEADIARVFGIEQRHERPLEAVVERIGDSDSLLLLDGCEVLADPVARIVSVLVGRNPRIRLLLTTTVALDVEGEVLLGLEPLGADDAARLFTERAAAVGADLVDDDPALRAVCEQLDFLPLAVELAAARAALLTPAQMLERLQDAALLRSTSAAGRRSLDAALDWTVGLLSNGTASSLERFGVFRDGFDLDAAEEVVDSGFALDHVAELARHSLLSTARRGGVVRYEMLDSIRRYAERRLEASGGLEQTRLAHARYYRDWAVVAERGLNGPDQIEWLVRFDAEHGNLRAALEFLLDEGDPAGALDLASAVSWFWFLRAHLQEGWYWLERVLTATEHEHTIPRVRALIRASQFAWEQGANEQARDWLDEASVLAEELGSEIHEAWASAHLALLDVIDARDEDAAARAGEARRAFERSGNFVGAGFATFVESIAPLLPAFREDRIDRTDVLDALERMERLGEVARSVGERNLIGHVEWGIGTLAVTAERLETARDHLALGARNFIELGNLSCLAHVLDTLALLEALGGRARSAGEVLGMVSTLRERSGMKGHDFERLLHERAWSSASAVIGAEALGEHFESGAALPLDAVLARAWSGGDGPDAIGE